MATFTSTAVLFAILGAGAVGDHEPVARLVQQSCPTFHMFHSSGYRDHKLPHISVEILQPRPPLACPLR